MLWFTPYKKTKLEICKVLVIGARVPDLRYQVDSYDWNELPDDLNLSYYDSVILYLDSLERKPSNSLPTRKLTRKMVGRFLFQKNCELVAVGNPNSTFEEDDEVMNVSWWLPLQLQTSKVAPAKLGTCRGEFSNLLKKLPNADWVFSKASRPVDDSAEFARMIHLKLSGVGSSVNSVVSVPEAQGGLSA